MPYYSESESKALREAFEEIVLQWPGVTKRKLFGSPSYVTAGTSFALLVDGGIILTRLDEGTRAVLLAEPGTSLFIGHGRVVKRWVLVEIRATAGIDRFVPFVRASYEGAREQGRE